MALTTRQFAVLVLLASLAVLGTALLSQYWGGLVPCELCLLQRWPWRVAIVLAAVAFLVGDRISLTVTALTIALVFFISAGLGFYHVGVEQHWFAGPTACSASAGLTATTVEELRRQLEAAPVVMCDQVQWALFGVSLAGWNMIASLALAAFCAASAAWCAPRQRLA
ncbi:MAG TPA: disulfide bond formation protein B [Stellaceae bacterium]|nr:disulfide bond formation protein B [Stellaceae bacterium]